MSIKNLFDNRPNQLLSASDLEKLEKDVESHEYVEEKIKDDYRFVPRTTIDFDDPKTFARYGSAKKYYEDAINSIKNTYPYDGSLKEKLEWHNKSTYIDNWIFENKYPRSNGHIVLNDGTIGATASISYHDGEANEVHRTTVNPQYIDIDGGLNIDLSIKGEKLSKAWDNSSNV